MKATQLGEPILWGFRGVLTPIQKHTGMGTGTGAVFRGSSHAGCCRFGAVHPYTHHGDPHPSRHRHPRCPQHPAGCHHGHRAPTWGHHGSVPPGWAQGGARARSPAWAAASRDPSLGRVGLTCPVPHPSSQPPSPMGTSQSWEHRGSATLGESGRRRRVSRCRGTSPRHHGPQSMWHRPTRCHRVPKSSGSRNGVPKVPRTGGTSPGLGPTGAGHVPALPAGPGGSDLFTGGGFLFIYWRYF